MRCKVHKSKTSVRVRKRHNWNSYVPRRVRGQPCYPFIQRLESLREFDCVTLKQDTALTQNHPACLSSTSCQASNELITQHVLGRYLDGLGADRVQRRVCNQVSGCSESSRKPSLSSREGGNAMCVCEGASASVQRSGSFFPCSCSADITSNRVAFFNQDDFSTPITKGEKALIQ